MSPAGHVPAAIATPTVLLWPARLVWGRCLHALIPTALAPGTAVLLTGTVHANPIDALLTALPLSSH
ncbi:hypothetical protein MMARE11_p00800 (plasmid) [Mycobacterium marinum E11]|nr:hypothetical protein NJB1604_00310 [Mycobacterium marinum]CDM79582.1 hypothetical protein MMARE11_p00800 [Mycobacterium marinum E11]